MIKFTKTLLLALLIVTYSCSNDDDDVPIINLEDLEVTIDENPTNGQIIGTVQSNSNSSLTFSITSQTPSGALNIDASSGELTVADAALFDFETNPIITATVSANEAQNTSSVIINVNNTNELSIQDFSATIDENPTNGDIIGSVQATGDSTLSFSIVSQTPAGALNIDVGTGVLSVADASLFDFETNPAITATISVDNSGNTQTITATINLNNVNELNVQDFTATIDENPTNGDVIGLVQATGDGTLSFSITSQTPAGALSIDANTGELTVADAALFDFETNSVITTTISVDNSGNTQTANATIGLNDLHEVGEFKFGGVIFWVNPAGDEGYVVSLTDQSFGAQWGCSGTSITGATDSTLGSGEANTVAIEINCTTAGTAADLTANLNLNGYDDWFLPSKDELNEIYLNRVVVNASLVVNGGTDVTAAYWTSTELDSNGAWYQAFSNGSQFGVSKTLPLKVRAIRAWTDF